MSNQAVVLSSQALCGFQNLFTCALLEDIVAFIHGKGGSPSGFSVSAVKGLNNSHGLDSC